MSTHEETTTPAETLADDEFVEQPIGFRPYWKPFEDKNELGHFGSFIGKLVMFDATRLGYESWVFEACQPVKCFTGAKKERKEVLVETGQPFSVGSWKQLDALKDYFGLKVKITAESKTTLKDGNTVWNWQLQVAKSDVAALNQRRAEAVHELRSHDAPSVHALPAINSSTHDAFPV